MVVPTAVPTASTPRPNACDGAIPYTVCWYSADKAPLRACVPCDKCDPVTLCVPRTIKTPSAIACGALTAPPALLAARPAPDWPRPRAARRKPPSRQRANPAGEGRTSPRPAPGLRVRRPRCQVALPEEKPDEFMAAAASFCNDRLFGTLSATIYVHPREGRTHGQALQARPLFPWQPRRRPEQRVLRLGSRLDSDGL